MSEAVTIPLAEQGAAEEAANEALTDLAFVPSAPLHAVPAAYDAGTTYAKGDLASESGQAYRSQAAANKGNQPSLDADFAHWAPVSISTVLLTNPAQFDDPTPLMQQAHNNTPPASSAATATPAETVGTGEETPV